MNIIRNSISILLFTTTIMIGCEKVVDLKLDNSTPIVVIDASINDLNESQIVKISKTYNFTEPNRFNGVGGAVVVLTTPEGASINYTETSPGIYQTIKMKGTPGKRYRLDVSLEGETYTAYSTMPNKVTLDSLTFKKFNFFGEENDYLAVNYNDPPGVNNQYRYILKVKGIIEEDKVNEDRFNDGNKVSDVIFYDVNDLVAGDKLDVEFQCIDRNVYRYFYSLGQSNGSGGPPVSPSNPVSNFSNNALGVFNAHTSSKLSVVIK